MRHEMKDNIKYTTLYLSCNQIKIDIWLVKNSRSKEHELHNRNPKYRTNQSSPNAL